MTDLALQPLDLQNGSYTAQQDRLLLDSILQGEGVVGPLDFQCTAASLTVTAGAGEAFVKGTTNANQGIYNVVATSTTAVTLASNSGGGNPRLDQIVLRIYDKTEAGGSYDKATIEVVQGTPSATGTVDARGGVTALPASCILLADASITTGNVVTLRDRRKSVTNGGVPPIITNTTVPMVAFEDPPGVVSDYAAGSITAGGITVNDNGKQTAVLQYLPNRIVGATRIRFRYVQGTTQIAAGSWIVSIYDASGRLIVSTPSTLFTGSANSIQNISAVITATTFEAGLYYVHVGTTGSTAASWVNFLGSNPFTAFVPNLVYYWAAGGITPPASFQTTTAATDAYTLDPTTTRYPYVPKIALSVG